MQHMHLEDTGHITKGQTFSSEYAFLHGSSFETWKSGDIISTLQEKHHLYTG
jgi:hypothetical protein